MYKIFKIAPIFLCLAMLNACAPSIKSNVTHFHQLPAPAGNTIEVIAMNPTLQQSIEFGAYADMIGNKLGRHGYNPASGSASHYIAEIEYMSGPIQQMIAEGRSPISVGVGVGSGGYRRGTSVGLGLSTSFGSSNNQQNYLNRLSMNIIDLSTGERLYEGQVETVTRNPNLAQNMPIMVNALFEDFPGESGTSNTVTLKPE